jgi:hypothetical protein
VFLWIPATIHIICSFKDLDLQEGIELAYLYRGLLDKVIFSVSPLVKVASGGL